MNDDMRVISTDEELKIFNDPYRMKIIKTFQQSEEPLTVKACADIMGEVPAKVYYHVKKLIAIDILELDHIEVINGINAKYYKLPKKTFTISIKDGDETEVFKRLSQVHTIISNMIEDFKGKFMKSSSRAIEQKIKDDTESGFFTNNDIYLSKEEFTELIKYFRTLGDKYKKKDKNKKAYSYMIDVARDLDKQKTE